MSEDIYAALFAAQQEISNAAESGKNTHFDSTYPTLKDVLAAVKDPLNAHGILIYQAPVRNENERGAVTVLRHVESATELREELTIPIASPTGHSIGSGTTYAKRLTLMAMCAITSDSEDEDANVITATAQKTARTGVMAAVMQEGVSFSAAQRDRIVNDIDAIFTVEGSGRSRKATCSDLDGLRDLLNEANTDNDLKIAVWNELPSIIRTYLKQMDQDDA